jgi:protein-S-isoprenylcysteine O-methyltransferase Ste14
MYGHPSRRSQARDLDAASENKRREGGVSFRQVAQRIRVSAGFVLAPLLFISARPTPGSLAAGAFVAIIGLAIRAWASGHLKKNQELTTSGPYAHTRNPLYLGTFLLGVGVAVGGGTPWFVALFAVLYLIIYVPVMFAEADTMRELFSMEYPEYSDQVPLFVPRFTPYRAPFFSSDGTRTDRTRPIYRRRFDVSLYLGHREYRAAFGFVAAYALLAAKLAMSLG